MNCSRSLITKFSARFPAHERLMFWFASLYAPTYSFQLLYFYIFFFNYFSVLIFLIQIALFTTLRLSFGLGLLSCRCFQFFGLGAAGYISRSTAGFLRCVSCFSCFLRFSVYGLCLGFFRLSARFLLLLLCLRLESQLEYVSPPAANENRRNAAALRWRALLATVSPESISTVRHFQ